MTHPQERPRPLAPEPTPQFDLPDLRLIAEGLVESALLWPGMAQPPERTWSLMAASDAFEAWVIGWPPGGAIELHDHGSSAGVVAVAAGTLTEHAVSHDRGRVLSVTRRRVGVGSALTFPAGHVHDVVNADDSPAVSVHVYAPRLESMTHFRIDGHRLVRGRTILSPVSADVA